MMCVWRVYGGVARNAAGPDVAKIVRSVIAVVGPGRVVG